MLQQRVSTLVEGEKAETVRLENLKEIGVRLKVQANISFGPSTGDVRMGRASSATKAEGK